MGCALRKYENSNVQTFTRQTSTVIKKVVFMSGTIATQSTGYAFIKGLDTHSQPIVLTFSHICIAAKDASKA